jgi:GNAT superfamily N-acetyltransferase
MKPLDQFEKWFDDQPDEVRSDCAHYALFFDLFEGSTTKVEEDFRNWIREGYDLAFEAILVRILTLREILTIAVFFTRGSEAEWQRAEEMHLRVYESFQRKGLGKEAEDIDKMVERLPERSQMWIKASASWKELIDGSLSNQALHSWFVEELDRTTRRKGEGSGDVPNS